MYSGQIQNLTVTVGGASFGGGITRYGSGQISNVIDATTAGVAGETEGMDSDGTGGTIDNLESGHGLLDTDLVAIAKSDRETDNSLTCRYSIDIDTATATTIVFDNNSSSAGDALPTADNVDVVVNKLNDEINTDFAGNDMLIFGMLSSTNAWVQFQDNSGTALANFILLANEPYDWVKDRGPTNPLSGAAVGKIKVANLSTSAGTFEIAVLLDTEV